VKQGAAYKIILDRMVGQEKLHEKAFCVSAGNLLSDRAVVNNMSTAMQSRLIHINMGIDKDDWINWAAKAGVDNRVISFIEWQPNKLHAFDPAHQDDTFACQRTWEFVSRILKTIGTLTREKLPLIAGAVSHGIALEFKAFCDLSADLVKFPDIMKDPENANIPTQDAGSMYAVVGMIASHMDKDNADTVMKYITRMPIEFQLCTVQRVYRQDEDIIENTTVRDWLIANAQDMLSDD
jgi:hypothetical protein